MFWFVLFEARSYSVALAGLKVVTILLPLPLLPEYKDCMHALP